MKTFPKALLAALFAAFASTCLAFPPLPENPGLTDAMQPALAQAGDLSFVALGARLRETKAVPAARKIELQSEVDGLLARFQAAYRNAEPDYSPLREHFDRLIARLQVALKKDPNLVRDIARSKEALWEGLAGGVLVAGAE
jgi:hypothetical protein